VTALQLLLLHRVGVDMIFAAADRVVTFPGPEGPQEAAAVVKALSNQPFEPAGGRTLVCKFAKWVPEPGAGAPQKDPQVSSCTYMLPVHFCSACS
jgi:hypothetical protein